MYIVGREVADKNGQIYRYCKLIEIVVTDNGPRQRMLLYLGNLN